MRCWHVSTARIDTVVIVALRIFDGFFIGERLFSVDVGERLRPVCTPLMNLLARLQIQVAWYGSVRPVTLMLWPIWLFLFLLKSDTGVERATCWPALRFRSLLLHG